MKNMTILLILLMGVILVHPGQAQEETNRFEEGKVTFSISNQVWATPAKDQGRTGTCWCFSTTSFIESETKRLTGKEFELSEMYTVYFSYLEKGERYLRLWGNNNLGQGGLSHDLQYLVPKYGMVRKSDYSGLMPEQEGHNHRSLFNDFKQYLDGIVETRAGFPDNFREACTEILTRNLGAPSEKITVDGNEITPVEFASEILQFDAANYVEITSYSYMPFYQRGELLVPDNWMRSEEYINVPLEDMVAIAKHALENGYSFVVDLDVSETTNLSGDRGIKYLPEDLTGEVIDQARRDAMFDSLATTDDHLMHTVGLATDGEGLVYFYTKDSGGQGYGPYEGFSFISENYFRGKVLAIFLHKDAIPDSIRSQLSIQ